MRVLVTGGAGQLGSALRATLKEHDVWCVGHADLDIVDQRAVEETLARFQPEVVINAAAYTDVDGAERDPERAFRTNGLGPQTLALACQRAGAALVQISTDYVFDGRKGSAYWEHDSPNPLSIYGRSKLAGEENALRHCQRTYVVRTSWLYGDPGRNFVKLILQLARERDVLTVVADEIGGPTWVVDLAAALGQLIQTGRYGIYHLANAGSCSRYELARRIARRVGREHVVHATTTAAYRATRPGMAVRPANSELKNFAAATALGITLRPWEEALDAFLDRLLAAEGAATR